MIYLFGRRIHFIGIGGVGVNALAEYALDLGAKVTGSDIKPNALCDKIASRGAKIWQGECPENVDGACAVVYSSAIKPDNAELVRAKELGIPTFERQQFLYEASKNFGRVIAIAGTHGKTTTTAMLAHILRRANKEFAAMIGGETTEFGNYVNDVGARKNMKEADFVVEACEYKRNFLWLDPHIGAITNAECDHPDCYANLDEVEEAFGKFADKCRVLLLPVSLLHLTGIPDEKSKSDFDIALRGRGAVRNIYGLKYLSDFEGAMLKDGEEFARIKLDGGGKYNLRNALFAVACAEALDVDGKFAAESLNTFEGVKRRFEYAGRLGDAPVYFDFAHHPTEIRCLLERAKQYGKVAVVFQPHTYSRTAAYLDDFVQALSDEVVSKVCLISSYAARESADMGVDVEAIADGINNKTSKPEVYIAKTIDEALICANEHMRDCNIVLFVGAGDIYAAFSRFHN